MQQYDRLMKRLADTNYVKTLPIFGDLNLLEFTRLPAMTPVLKKQGFELEQLMKINHKDHVKLNKFMK